MNIRYCQQCGKELALMEIGDEGATPYCVGCERPHFGHPPCAVLVAVVSESMDVVLLRQDYVSESNWVLVAGYVKAGESLEHAVQREVLEETGLKIYDCRYVSSYPYAKKDLLMVGFVAFSADDRFLQESKEVDDIRWESLRAAPSRLRTGSIGHEHVLNVIRCLKDLHPADLINPGAPEHGTQREV